MTGVLRFTVPGQPLPAERPRTVQRGPRRVTITPDRTLAAEARVAAAFRFVHPHHRVDPAHEWALVVVCYREGRARADVDNLAKTVLDGLNGVLYADDAQVSRLDVTRVLGAGKGNGRTEVSAYPALTPGHRATLTSVSTPLLPPEGTPA